jgi:hypothetical protein
MLVSQSAVHVARGIPLYGRHFAVDVAGQKLLRVGQVSKVEWNVTGGAWNGARKGGSDSKASRPSVSDVNKAIEREQHKATGVYPTLCIKLQ